ncbi:hypothetical protein GOP47_0028504 [Adiantum capillus-veneris]|nr:hypothetical protein GOP47_0028504 [Adiantum capillus-veneris]
MDYGHICMERHYLPAQHRWQECSQHSQHRRHSAKRWRRTAACRSSGWSWPQQGSHRSPIANFCQDQHHPPRLIALKDLTNKKSSHNDVIISRGEGRESGKAKRVTKVPTRSKENISTLVCKFKKRNLIPSHKKVILLTHNGELKMTTKEAIALKLMGEHNIDVMYRQLADFLKELQWTTPKESFNFKKECQDSEALDVLVCWAIGQNKIQLKDTNKDMV